tara:strand:+ start:145 stop:270 length:126 start_codon:yes stop_codon:yes gene_type:complete
MLEEIFKSTMKGKDIKEREVEKKETTRNKERKRKSATLVVG